MQAKWTEQILDEVFESLRRQRPDLDPDRARPYPESDGYGGP